jgi:hypothetical protein
VLVGGVDEHGLPRLLAPDDVDVVVQGADHHPVDLDQAVLVMQHASLLGFRPPSDGRGRPVGVATGGPGTGGVYGLHLIDWVVNNGPVW